MTTPPNALDTPVGVPTSTRPDQPVPASGEAPQRAVRVRRSQAERRAESDQRIVAAAAALIVERGIDGASLAEIGRRAGYSHGLVHHRFGSKEALIERLNAEAMVLFTRHIQERIGTARGVEALRLLADAYLDLVASEDPLARVHLIVWANTVAAARQADPANPDRTFRAAFALLIRDAALDGSVRADINPEAIAMVMVGMLRGVALQILVEPERATAELRTVVLGQLTRMLAA